MKILVRVIYGAVALVCIAGVVAALIFALMWAMLDRSLPKNFPDDWNEYVWVSEEPKAFITCSKVCRPGLYGGQIEIDGEICNIKTRMWPGS